jgi:hypothetical protein
MTRKNTLDEYRQAGITLNALRLKSMALYVEYYKIFGVDATKHLEKLEIEIQDAIFDLENKMCRDFDEERKDEAFRNELRDFF